MAEQLKMVYVLDTGEVERIPLLEQGNNILG